MNQDLKKFEQLLKTDAEFQKKLKDSMKSCTNEQADEKTIFEEILIPVAKEYGISATFEEYQAYIKDVAENGADLSPDELSQVAGGGKGPGIGLNLCYKAGVGFGGVGAGFCVAIGADDTGICLGSGVSTDTL